MDKWFIKRLKVGVGVCFICFVLIGCGSVYKALGLTEEQTAGQVKKDQDAVIGVTEQGRTVLWQAVSAGIAGVGTVVTAMLGKWLATERKMSAAMIAGVEKANDGNAKKAITVESLRRGIGVKLADRVRKLT